MKYHSQLLKKYISINDTAENIAQKFILKTVEIEEVIERKLQKTIVIGRIEHAEPHPDSDHMNVCQVDCGEKGKFQIVCGASNVEAGLLVPVALVGTIFEKVGITIAPRKLRGVDSQGMICSKNELGISEDMDQSWIWDLRKDLEVSESDLGTPLSEKFERLESVVLDVDNKGLTNRPDLTGHFGAAVELNAMYAEQPDLIAYNKVKTYFETFKNTTISDLLEHTEKKLTTRKVKSETDGLNSYILMSLRNVEVKQNSFFSRLQTLDLGSKPINNWVDFGNLFMNITGQPVHFFDADRVEGDIIVRNAKEGEQFTDLFEVMHMLTANDIVIADGKKVLCLAGVMGGNNSGVTETTKNILVEIANFDPVAVRKTGVRLGLRTDSELRNEKNINPLFSLYALLLMLDEMKFYEKDLGNYELEGIDSYVKSSINPNEKKLVEVDYHQMMNFIFGKEVEDFEKKAKTILEGLGFGCTGNGVEVPLWRGPEDINIPEDITEEVARIWGYENIPNLPLLSQLKFQPFADEVEMTRKVEDFLVKQGRFDQVETYPWISEKNLTDFGQNASDVYQLENPINPETPYLRDSMAYNLLGITAKNSKFFDQFNIFDIGRVWKKTENYQAKEKIDERYANVNIDERLEVGGFLYQKSLATWEEDTFLRGKEVIQNFLEELGITKQLDFQKSDFHFYHPKKQTEILCNGKKIGELASFHPLVLKNNKLPETASVTFFFLNIPRLIDLVKEEGNKEYHYETLQDQILRRDLSLVVEGTQDFGAVIKAIREVEEVKEVEVFDLYQGATLGEGKKSISLRFKIIGESEKSLTTEEINTIMQKAIKAAECTGATLRA